MLDAVADSLYPCSAFRPVVSVKMYNLPHPHGLGSKVRIKLESKEEMKKRGVDSPDDADALALTFARRVVVQRATTVQEPPPRVGLWG